MNEEGFSALLHRVLNQMKEKGASEDKLMKATRRIQSRKSLLLSKKVQLKRPVVKLRKLSNLSIPNPDDIRQTAQVRKAVCGTADWNQTLEAFKKSLPIYKGA